MAQLLTSNFPEGPINEIKGKCIFLPGDDIDTDRIIPARYLKCVDFNALGNQVFTDDRLELNGSHPFDLSTNKDASILIVNDNFGCGSSREHAPQALMRWGIRAIVGESFAEIFYGNCLSLGIPCVIASKIEINDIVNLVKADSSSEWNLNVRDQNFCNKENKFKVNINPISIEMLTSGKWDGTSQLISNQRQIKAMLGRLPYLNNFPTNIKTTN